MVPAMVPACYEQRELGQQGGRGRTNLRIEQQEAREYFVMQTYFDKLVFW